MFSANALPTPSVGKGKGTLEGVLGLYSLSRVKICQSVRLALSFLPQRVPASFADYVGAVLLGRFTWLKDGTEPIVQIYRQRVGLFVPPQDHSQFYL